VAVEELLAAVVQIVLEVLLQVLVSGGLDVAASASSKRDQSGCGWLVFHGLLGGVVGWLSTLLFPHLMLPVVWLRVLNLVLAPFLAGGLTFYMDRWWNRGKDGSTAFFHGFTFAVLFGLARFAFGAR
jgi:hypothetical protein